jgi:hypothetical protein
MKNVLFYFIPVYVAGMLLRGFAPTLLSDSLKYSLVIGFSFMGLLMVLRSFGERKSPMLSWLLVLLYHFSVVLAVSFNEQFGFSQVIIYLSGILPSAIVGWYCMRHLQKTEPKYFHLNQYMGHVYEHPRLAFVFFVASLGLMGFPISLSFIGEDLLFSHIQEHQYLLAFIESLSYIMAGISLVRIYARLFLGPHVKLYHETPLRSS